MSRTRFLPSHLKETDEKKKEHDLRQELQSILGGFQLLDLIITELKSHMIC